MTSNLRDAHILVASDSIDDATPVKKALLDEFSSIEISTDSMLSVADFDRCRPQVVVLAFKDMKRATDYYLRLLQHSPIAHSHPHRTVLLCGKDDAAAAFGLCKKESFDDYVLYWPMAFDGQRLTMSVWSACRDLAGSRSRGASVAELNEHASRLAAMETSVAEQIAEGARLAAAARAAIANASSEAAAASGADAAREALGASHDSTTPLLDWADQLGASVSPQLADVQRLADKIRSSRPMIMVVDDDAFATRLVAKALEAQPWNLVFASESVEAFGKLEDARPTVILMDVNLPGLDGLAITERLKTMPGLADIPVIMLTGEARRETLERSRMVGAASFIVKPFTRDSLIAKLAPFMT
jgi:CheY-like chemotaxis protein